MSAGGPIVDPKADLMLITPINPHSALAKSIVVGSDAVIDVTLAKRRQEEDEEAEVSFGRRSFRAYESGRQYPNSESGCTCKNFEVKSVELFTDSAEKNAGISLGGA